MSKPFIPVALALAFALPSCGTAGNPPDGTSGDDGDWQNVQAPSAATASTFTRTR